MTTTPELLDAAKTAMGLTSDYQLAKALQWPFTTVSNYRTGRNAMGVEQVADFHIKTGIPLEIVVNTAAEDSKRIRARKLSQPRQASLKLSTAA